MSKHTPGPWSYEVHELSTGFSGIVYGPTGHRIGSSGGTDHLTEEDARLIAAAPEMLEALKEAHPFINDENARSLVANIISKAEGRS